MRVVKRESGYKLACFYMRIEAVSGDGLMEEFGQCCLMSDCFLSFRSQVKKKVTFLERNSHLLFI